MSKAERRSKNEEVDSCPDSNGTSEGTWYIVLGTLYNELLLLACLPQAGFLNYLVLNTTITIHPNNQLDLGRTFSSSPVCLRLCARNKELGLPKHNANVVVCQPHSQ